MFPHVNILYNVQTKVSMHLQIHHLFSFCGENIKNLPLEEYDADDLHMISNHHTMNRTLALHSPR